MEAHNDQKRPISTLCDSSGQALLRSREIIMRIILIITLLILTGCVHTTKVGFLFLKNNTDSLLYGNLKQVNAASPSNEFAVPAGNGIELVKYDIKPGEESNILEQVAELKLRSDSCVVVLDSKSIAKNTIVDSPSMIIKIKPVLFDKCK